MMKNGYCEIEILGQKTGLKFNMYAIEMMQEIKGRNSTTKNLTAIVFAGMMGNAYVKQTEPDFSFEDVSDWVDLQMLNQDQGGYLQMVSECFNESEVIKSTVARAQNGQATEDEKKSLIVASM